MSNQDRPSTTLDEYMRREHMPNADMAERVRMLRRHPVSPSPAEISHWRRGRRMPHHDMRQWIEFATGGEVVAESWELASAPSVVRSSG